MEIKGIKYLCPILDHSGYGECSRQYVLALHKLGVPITVEPISFEATRPTLQHEELLYSLINKPIDYNIKIMHLTPEHYPKYKEEGVVNIGYAVWETSKLFKDWPGYINDNVTAQIVASQWNVEVFKDSNVNVPVYCVPHGINISDFENVKTFDIEGLDEDDFVFYNISQFTERKHPSALLKAYWATFRNNEKVALVFKTYRSDYSDAEKNAVRLTIKRLKEVFPSNRHPKVLLIGDLLSREEILGLHKRGDCYLSLDRGEGYGMVPLEAGACGNPIIVTGMGGVLEYAKPDNSYLVNYTWTPVFGMTWIPWYAGGDQWWAEPDLKHASELMMHVYKNRDEARERGKRLQQFIRENLSWEAVGTKYLEVLKSIEV